MDGIEMVNGIEVLVNEGFKKPNISLSSKVTVSDTFRQDLNQWLLDVFGFETLEFIQDGDFIRKDNTIFVNKRTHNHLKETGKETCQSHKNNLSA